MTLFVDSSAWYAAADSSAIDNARAKEILQSDASLLTTDHILVETWLLINSRLHRAAAESFWQGTRNQNVGVEIVTAEDVNAASHIGAFFADQEFSLVDRTSFAVMERLGLKQVASFDKDFLIYRYGPHKDLAFEVLR